MPAAMAPRMTGLTAGLGCGRARAGGAQAGTARTAEEEGGGARSSRSSAPLREGGGRWWPCGSSPGRPEEAVAVEAGGGHGERARAGRAASSSGVRAGGGAAACGRAPTEREGRGEADGERGVETPPELGVEEVAARPPRLQPRPGPPAAAQAHGRREEAPGGREEEGAAPRGEGGGEGAAHAAVVAMGLFARAAAAGPACVPPPLACSREVPARRGGSRECQIEEGECERREKGLLLPPPATMPVHPPRGGMGAAELADGRAEGDRRARAPEDERSSATTHRHGRRPRGPPRSPVPLAPDPAVPHARHGRPACSSPSCALPHRGRPRARRRRPWW